MNYVPGYGHDVFVSYAHVDDLTDRDDEDGWVSALIKKLNNRLAQLLGRQDSFSLWYDQQQLHQNVSITPEIMSTLDRTATLVVILSPGYLESEWCTDERETFLKLVEERRRNDGCVFVVERRQVRAGGASSPIWRSPGLPLLEVRSQGKASNFGDVAIQRR